MRLKRLGVALSASLALAAVLASSAFATATTAKSYWSVAGTSLASGETAAIICSAAEGQDFVLGGTVAGTEAEISATSLECPSGGVIKQEGEHAVATGTLKFSGLTVRKPAGCTTSASITTKALTAKIYMEGVTVYTRFAPTAGETGTFASISLEGCAAEGTYPIKGTLFGQWSNATETAATDQPLTFSPTIQSNAGGSMTLGSEPMGFTGKSTWEILEEGAHAIFEISEAVSRTGFHGDCFC